MAQNDIIDIDELIDANINLNKPIERMPTNVPEPVADKIYPSGQGTPGQFIPNDFKNFLVEKTGIAPGTLDFVLGRPYSFRDRFVNLNPVDGIRDLLRAGLPGDQPLDRETQQPFGLNINELFNPSDPTTKAAENAGINVKDGAPFQVQKDASYLPADNYERGVKMLLKEAYPGVPLDAFELAMEPRTNRIVYKDPESGEKQFVQPPGIDWADVKAVVEPVFLEAGLGVAGFMAGNTVGRGQGAAIGGTAGTLTAAQISENPFVQLAGTVTGATLGAVNPARPLAFTVMGETTGHYIWRLKNLQGMKERGILDETYTTEKIYETALKDSKMVAAFSLGGNAAFGALAKYLGRNPTSALGIDPDEFTKAWDNVGEKVATGSDAEKQALSNLSTPQVLAFAEKSTPIRREIMQNQLDETIAKYGDVEQRFLDQFDDFRLGYDKVFEEAGINTDIVILPDVSKIKQGFGRDVGAYFDVEDFAKPSRGDVTFPKEQQTVIKEMSGKLEGAEPEEIFDIIWTTGKPTKTEAFIDVVKNGPAKQLDQFKTLVYRDFIDSTNNFDPNAIQGYLNKHNDQLKALYGEEFTDGLRSYSKLIKNMKVVAKAESIPEQVLLKTLTTLARAYVGIFTRTGRVITAGTKIGQKTRTSNFEDMLLNPALLNKRIQRGKFLQEPLGEGSSVSFYDAARALSRGYALEDNAVDPSETGVNLPTQERIIEDFDIEDLGMNMGGNPLMELQYGYGED